MRGGVYAPGQPRSDRETSGRKIFGKPFRAIDAVTGRAPGPNDRHLGKVRIPPFPLI